MIPNPDLSIFDEGANNEERCGVIIMRPDCTTYVMEVPNRSDDPRRHFIINRSDVEVLDWPSSHKMVGVIHTHPFRGMRAASQHDIDSIPEGLVGMVYHPSSGSIVWYDRSGVILEKLKRRR